MKTVGVVMLMVDLVRTIRQAIDGRTQRVDGRRLGRGLLVGLGVGVMLPLLIPPAVEWAAGFVQFSNPAAEQLPAAEQVYRSWTWGMAWFLGWFLLPAAVVYIAGGLSGEGTVSVLAFGITWWSTASFVNSHPLNFAWFLWAIAFVGAFEGHRWVQAGGPRGKTVECPECGYYFERASLNCPECGTDYTQGQQASPDPHTEVDGPRI